MPLRELLEKILDNPNAHVGSISPLDLGAFFQGMCAANIVVAHLTEAMTVQFNGPDAMDVWSRAYLRFNDDAAAFESLIHAARTSLPNLGDIRSKIGWMKSGYSPSRS